MFGPFHLDPHERVLRRDGNRLPLAPKAFDLLVALVERHGRLVDKHVLLDEVWPQTAVEESNIAQTVFVLRKTLGTAETGQPYIETVPKRGYRFTGVVRELSDTEAELVFERRTRLEISDRPSAIRALGLQSSRFRFVVIASVTLTALVIAAGLTWFIRPGQGSNVSAAARERISIDRITTTGRVGAAAVSPDGRYVAYVLDEHRKQSLWARDLRTGSHLQIVPPDTVDYWGLTFDRDSAYVYATMWSWERTDSSVMRVPVLGGEIAEVLPKGGPISFSPDGRLFAQIETSDRLAQSSIVLYRRDGAFERTLAVRQEPETFHNVDGGTPMWSPDGQRIAAPVVLKHSNAIRQVLVAIDVGTGAEERLTQRDWAAIGRLCWLPDGKRIVFTAREQHTSPLHIWELFLPEDHVRPLTADPMDYDGLSVTENGESLVTVRSELSFSIWTGPSDGSEQFHQLTAEVGVPRQGDAFSWTPDGRVVYASTAGGPLDLWIADAAGVHRRRLTADAARDFHPAVSPDGRWIVYASDRDGAISLWRINVEGRDLSRVTQGSGGGDVYPRWLPDGTALVFQRGYLWGETIKVAKVGVDRGGPELLTDRTSLRPVVSPDGRRYAYFRMDPGGWRLVVASVDTGQQVAAFTPSRSSKSRAIRWTPDSTAVAFIDAPDGVHNIWFQPIDGSGPAKQLTHFEPGPPIEFFDWSPDGRKLGIARQTISSDVVRVTGF